jgi:outer membrane cobalamin receptor
MFMRFSRFVLCLSLLTAISSATDFTVKVIDPHSAVVSGAQVQLLNKSNNSLLAVATTSAEGLAVFRNVAQGDLQLRVLAPGFAVNISDPTASTEVFTISLQVSPATETVTVTAARTPVANDVAITEASALDARQLEVMHPTAASDSLRFLPGAVVETAGQRGGIASLFVRGGDSRYNKVIVDGVPVNDPGGTFDFGVIPMTEFDRIEFVRGAESTLYGSDAMTSVVQMWTQTGSTGIPELTLGADGGNFGTANGYGTLAGARGRFDYALFADQFNTNGQGPNADYFNSSQGANLGVRISDHVGFRFRTRHSNNRTGVPGEWKFNGSALMPPDAEQFAAQNNFLASAELSISAPSRWQHHITGYEYNHRRSNIDSVNEPGRIFDFPFNSLANINRAGFDYQGSYLERSWAQTTFGYEFEDENGFVGDPTAPPMTHGLRRNHAVFGQQLLTLGRVSLVLGARYVHNETFGDKFVPRAAAAVQLLKGENTFSGTQLRFSYATGIKAPRFEESFAQGPFILPSPELKAEQNRAFEAGIQQGLFSGKFALTAIYYNNLFRDQIDFAIVDPFTFLGQYMNINKSIAHGAEVELSGHLLPRLSLNAGYNYASTQILEAPAAFDDIHQPGNPLIRRPKHSGSLLLTYLGNHWGGSLGGSFIGRRQDSDFLGLGIHHAAGYARIDLGAWYKIQSHVTAYANLENALNKEYEEVLGYPALGINVRAGLRFTFGGD